VIEVFATGDPYADFILRITHQIWEEREIEAIRTHYGERVPVRSPSGVTTSCQSVIDSTKATLAEFPDRQLIGEDVIHSGNDGEWLSSHRIYSTATHLGRGYFGEPTGRHLQYRVIADCAVRDDVIFDEWLVRDFGAIVRQMGSSPEEAARKIVAEAGGSTRTTDVMFASEAPVYRSRGNDHRAGRTLSRIAERLLTKRFDEARVDMDRACHFELPGGSKAQWRDSGLNSMSILFSPMSCIATQVDHAIGHNDTARGTRAAVRCTTIFRHDGVGDFGPPSGQEVHVMSIWHAEFAGEKVARLWLLLDEVAVWRQILSS
jgi:predicted ester cyclase